MDEKIRWVIENLETVCVERQRVIQGKIKERENDKRRKRKSEGCNTHTVEYPGCNAT
jgi:cytoskeletal protein CcmA (bactofilin family)